jgi:hypothetical protein
VSPRWLEPAGKFVRGRRFTRKIRGSRLAAQPIALQQTPLDGPDATTLLNKSSKDSPTAPRELRRVRRIIRDIHGLTPSGLALAPAGEVAHGYSSRGTHHNDERRVSEDGGAPLARSHRSGLCNADRST